MTVRLGKGGLQRGVEEFASLEEYCKWRPALAVVVLEIDAFIRGMWNQEM